MSDSYMSCNYQNCMAPLIKTAWITKCSHVFCEMHGDENFLNNLTKIKCPACNEINNKESDIIKSNLNPSDLIVSCVRPDKAVEYAIYACRLWNYQMQMKRKYNIEAVTQKYERLILEGTSQLQLENRDLKKYITEINARLRKLNEELTRTKQRFKKYKAAYESICSSKQNLHFHKGHRTGLLKNEPCFLHDKVSCEDDECISMDKDLLDKTLLDFH